MQQCVAAHAHHLRAIPVKESSGGLAYLGRMRHETHADGATLPLVLQHPAHAKEAQCERADELNVNRPLAADGGESIGQVERNKVDDGQKQGDLGAQKAPAVEVSRLRGLLWIKTVFAQGHGGNGRQGEQGQQQGKQIDDHRRRTPFFERDT